MSLELIVRGLYTRTAVARHPCFSWAWYVLWTYVVSNWAKCVLLCSQFIDEVMSLPVSYIYYIGTGEVE